MVAMGQFLRALGSLLVATTLADAGGGGARCPSAGLPAQGCSAAAAAAGGAEAAATSPRQAVPHPTAAQTDGRGAGNGSPILFILTDDQGWSDLSSTGSTYYESPNIDRCAFTPSPAGGQQGGAVGPLTHCVWLAASRPRA